MSRDYAGRTRSFHRELFIYSLCDVALSMMQIKLQVDQSFTTHTMVSILLDPRGSQGVRACDLSILYRLNFLLDISAHTSLSVSAHFFRGS